MPEAPERGGWFWAAGQIHGNGGTRPWTTVYSSDGKRYETRAEAITAGFERADASDDFNVGRVVAGELVWFGWMDKKYPIVEYGGITAALRSSGLNV
jgi:hypothetical protein